MRYLLFGGVVGVAGCAYVTSGELGDRLSELPGDTDRVEDIDTDSGIDTDTGIDTDGGTDTGVDTDTDSGGETDTDTGLDTDVDTDQDCTTLSNGGHDYAFCLGAIPWSDAQAVCEALGANLVTVDDEAENTWVFGRTEELGLTSGGHPYNAAWIGFNDIDVEGTWVWVSGSTSTYTNWYAPSPNDGTAANCGHIGAAGEWDDYYCTSVRPFVCESP